MKKLLILLLAGLVAFAFPVGAAATEPDDPYDADLEWDVH